MRQTIYWFALCALILPAALPAEPAHAACRPFDPRCVPSVLDRRPFEPTVCSVFQRYPCVPRWPGTLGEDLLLTIQSSKIDEYVKPDHDLNTISDLFAALRSCWHPPDGDNVSPGMQMTIRMSFKRDGVVFGQPRVTYSTRGISKETRATYHDAIVAAITRCAPLQLTKGLGGAIAGRPINIRYVDDRGDKQGQRNEQH